MIASDVMTTHLLTLHVDAQVKDAVALFSESAVHEFPVLDSAGTLVGEISSRSILHHAVPAYASSELLAAMRAGPDIPSVYNNLEAMQEKSLTELMTADVRTVSSRTPTSAVAAELVTIEGDNDHVYVVDDDHKLLGVISSRDVIRRFAERAA